MVKFSRGFILPFLVTVLAIACRDDELAGPRLNRPFPPSFVFAPGTGNESFFDQVRSSDGIGFAQGIDPSTLCNTFGSIHPASVVGINPSVSRAWISSDPENPFFAAQPGPVTFTFQRPILNPVVVGNGSLQCAELGEAIAYMHAGGTAHAAFQLAEGVNCGSDNMTCCFQTPPLVLDQLV